MQRLASRICGMAVAVTVLGVGWSSADDHGTGVQVANPWARASAGMTGAGAVYMTLSNPGAAADSLVAASSPIAATAELHTHIAEGDVMRMRPVDSIEVPAGETVELRPGGLHVMLMNLEAPLTRDETFPLTLSFATAGDVTVDVTVLAPGAMSGEDTHGRSH